MVWALSSAETVPVAEMTVGSRVLAAPRRPGSPLDNGFAGRTRFLAFPPGKPAAGFHSQTAVQAGGRVGPITLVAPRVRRSGTARSTGPRLDSLVVSAGGAVGNASREATTR